MEVKGSSLAGGGGGRRVVVTAEERERKGELLGAAAFIHVLGPYFDTSKLDLDKYHSLHRLRFCD